MKRSVAATSSSRAKSAVSDVSGASPAAKRAKSSASSRGLTNGFPDPLRNYSGSYKSDSKTPVVQPKLAKVNCAAGKCGLPSTNKLIPRRDTASKELLFTDFPEFRPNLKPAEVIKLGSFGGTYFRDIYSAPAKTEYSGDLVFKQLPWKDWGWVEGQDIQIDAGVVVATNLASNGFKFDNSPRTAKFSTSSMLTSPTYDVNQNRFGVKCGGSLDMWESSGWINPLDPYGWFQWYCWFYLGRRSDDDKRQIQRWLASAGPKGRFRNQLLNKCEKEGKIPEDARVSPVIRQTLQHWGLEVRAKK